MVSKGLLNCVVNPLCTRLTDISDMGHHLTQVQPVQLLTFVMLNWC